MKRIAILLWLVLAACGGDKKDTPPEPAAGSGSAVAQPGSGSAAPAGSGSAAGSGSGSAAAQAGSGSGSGSAAPPPVAEVNLPTEVDFEEEATARITEKTVDKELKTMEKDLAQ